MSEKISLVEKINCERNPNFLPDARKILDELQTGEVISATVYAKHRDGSVSVTRSYSNSPQEDAGEMLAMAMHRLGFKREE